MAGKMKNSNEEWFKHLQQMGEELWVDPEQERKDNKNSKIVGWGLGIGSIIWILFAVGGDGIAGFLLFMACLFGSYMLTED